MERPVTVLPGRETEDSDVYPIARIEDAGRHKTPILQGEYDSLSAMRPLGEEERQEADKQVNEKQATVRHEAYARQLTDDGTEAHLIDETDQPPSSDVLESFAPARLQSGGEFYSITLTERVSYPYEGVDVSQDTVEIDDETEEVLGVHMILYVHEDLEEDMIIHYDPAYLNNSRYNPAKDDLATDSPVPLKNPKTGEETNYEPADKTKFMGEYNGNKTVAEAIDAMKDGFENEFEKHGIRGEAAAMIQGEPHIFEKSQNHQYAEFLETVYSEIAQDPVGREYTTGENNVSEEPDSQMQLRDAGQTEVEDEAGHVQERLVEDARDRWLGYRHAAMIHSLEQLLEYRENGDI